MEAVALLGLMGVGYLLNDDKAKIHSIYADVQPPLQEGSGNTVYDIANYKDSKTYEQGLVQQSHDEALRGDSKVIDALNMQGRNTLRSDFTDASDG